MIEKVFQQSFVYFFRRGQRLEEKLEDMIEAKKLLVTFMKIWCSIITQIARHGI